MILDSRIERLLAAFMAGIIAVLLFFLRVAHNEVDVQRIAAEGARTALEAERSAGFAAARERLAAQEAQRVRHEAALSAIKDLNDSQVAAIDVRYRAALQRLRAQSAPVSGTPSDNSAVSAPAEVAGGSTEGMAEPRFVEALRSCEEGIATLNAVVRAVRETH